MFKKIYLFLVFLFFKNIPGSIGLKLRYFLYKPLFYKCGKNVRIGPGVIFNNIQNISLGNNIRIDEYCIFNVGNLNKNRIFSSNKFNLNQNKNSEIKLIIEDFVHINQFCLFSSFNYMKIDKYCTFSAGVKIYNVSHHFRNNKKRDQITYANNLDDKKAKYNSLVVSELIIHENVFVSINAIILNASIGQNSFIYPNSIVNRNIKENSIFKENKVIGKRFK